jgi:hypothetical protein
VAGARRKKAGWPRGPRGRMGRVAAWVGRPNVKEKNFRIKNWIFEFTKAWKIVEGDLGGIFTWGFFLNSSKLLKDFRKI